MTLERSDLSTVSAPARHISRSRQAAGITLSHDAQFEGLIPNGRFEDYIPIIRRVLCHYLLDQLPDEGLPEAYDSLGGMQEFYSEPHSQSVPRLPQHVTAASYGDSYERPEFRIAEE